MSLSIRGLMKRILSRSSRPQQPVSAPRQRRVRLGVEGLEARELPAAAPTATLSGGIHRGEGTNDADAISVRQVAGQLSFTGITIRDGAASVSQVAATRVTAIEVRCLGGNDVVWLNEAGAEV